MRTTVRVFCLLALCLLLALPTLAQDAAAPIIVLNEGGIFAVSPEDGSSQMLVAAPDDFAVLREETGDPVRVFSADWLSPDGQLLAYRTLLPAKSHELTVLDIASGALATVSLPDPGYVESVAWSPDGTQLAVVGQDIRENQAAGWWLNIFERDAWDTAVVATRLTSPDYAMSRRVFMMADAAVLVDHGIQSPRIVLTMLDSTGETQQQIDLNMNQFPDLNLYLNTPLNPLLVDDQHQFGLTRQNTDELAFVASLDTAEVSEYDYGYFPALVSSLAPDTSLRVSYSQNNGDSTMLLIRDANGDYLGEIDRVRTYAFGITNDNDGSTHVVSPDGQTLAWLDGDQLMLWRDGESQPLGVTAQALAWGPPLNTLVEDKAWLLG
jgi:dipeptidyl aminopeptidase/acylaminoacyl peptidase